MRDGFIFYESFRKAMKGLPAETQLLLYNAIADYALYDDEPDFGDDPIALGFFTLMRPQIDANIRKREGGAKGGRPAKETKQEPLDNLTETKEEPSDNLDETKAKPNDNLGVTKAKPKDNLSVTIAEPKAKEKDKAKDKANAKEKERALCAGTPRRFTKPRVEEIREYCRERKNGIDPQQFFDFYEAKGWRIGNQPMKDWQAAVRTWERRDAVGAQSKSPPVRRFGKNERTRIDQHAYSDEDLSHLLVDLDAPLPDELKGAG